MASFAAALGAAKSELASSGDGARALAALRGALNAANGAELESAGRFVKRVLAKQPELVARRVALLGQCTTHWLVNGLIAVAQADGRGLAVHEGEYDNVMQELLSPALVEFAPEIIVLLPWNRRLLAPGKRGVEERISSEVAFWQNAWQLVATRFGARLVQVGYDWVHPGELGYHLGGQLGGPLALVRQCNELLRRRLPDGAYFVDLPAVAGDFGRRHFYDLRQDFWAKQPFSTDGSAWLAQHVWAGARATLEGPKKVLALDLDNTLWGGVVGELGALGVELGESPDGEAFRELQAFAQRLRERGTVLAVTSKNNDADAREPFTRNPNMLLKLDELAAFEASWQPKPASLAKIAESLKLGIDSFVFVDDSAFEREAVRQALPAVSVVELPNEPAEYARAIVQSLAFEAAGVTRADLERGEQYAAEAERTRAAVSFASQDEYLASLEMKATLGAIDEARLARVVQLIGKTNQFNLTTRRHSRSDVEALLARPGAVAFTVELSDRFGGYGLIAVVLAVPAPAERTLEVDTWLMSCRAIGRGVEDFTFAALLGEARKLGYLALEAEYLPTAKNQVVAGLYEALGFSRLSSDEAGRVRYRLLLEGAQARPSFVNLGGEPT